MPPGAPWCAPRAPPSRGALAPPNRRVALGEALELRYDALEPFKLPRRLLYAGDAHAEFDLLLAHRGEVLRSPYMSYPARRCRRAGVIHYSDPISGASVAVAAAAAAIPAPEP